MLFSSRDLSQSDKLLASTLALFAAAAAFVAAVDGPNWLAVSLLGLSFAAAVFALAVKTKYVWVTVREAQVEMFRLPISPLRESIDQRLFYDLGVDVEAPEAKALLGIAVSAHP